MLNHISLRTRVYLLLGALVLTNMAGAAITLWYTARTQSLYTSEIDRDLLAFMAAEKLVTALVMQKGFVTYFFLDGKSEWLDRLMENHQDFLGWLAKARETTFLADTRSILNQIESNYIRFAYSRDEVIRLYREGDREKGFAQHLEVRKKFHAIYNLCEQYKRVLEEDIRETHEVYRKSAHMVTIMAWGAIPGSVVLGFLLAYIFIRQILIPIRRMAITDGVPRSEENTFVNEVKTLSTRVHTLVSDVHQAQSKLEESQEHLIQSEKLALVGRMAAGVAHSVRNPLTSVKMRLFSLERSLRLNPTQKDDLDVISEEIGHIDTIVQNFLDFSRPPKLKLQQISPSDVVDMTLQLLRYRIETHGIKNHVKRQQKLEDVMLDSDQLKEVLSNLLLNASEAMHEGGHIAIEEEIREHKHLGKMAVIRIKDDGPGIPEAIHHRVFEPFFSTKEEGSGLGLSIARRIIEEHGGQINLKSQEERGTTFEILLPCKEEESV